MPEEAAKVSRGTSQLQCVQVASTAAVQAQQVSRSQGGILGTRCYQ